jgi:hypothetical protein
VQELVGAPHELAQLCPDVARRLLLPDQGFLVEVRGRLAGLVGRRLGAALLLLAEGPGQRGLDLARAGEEGADVNPRLVLDLLQYLLVGGLHHGDVDAEALFVDLEGDALVPAAEALVEQAHQMGADLASLQLDHWHAEELGHRRDQGLLVNELQRHQGSREVATMTLQLAVCGHPRALVDQALVEKVLP